MYLRCTGTLITPLVTTARALRLPVDEGAVAIFALPANTLSRLPPSAPEPFQLFLDLLDIAVGLLVTWVA